MKRLIPYQRHPEPRLQALWDGTQIALLLMPFSSLLGSVAISVISLILVQQKFQLVVRRPVNWGLAVVSLLMILSAALAEYKAEAFLGLANFLPFFIIFAALSELIQTIAQLRRIAWIIVSASVVVVLIGFGQQFLGWTGNIQLPGSVVAWNIYPTGNPPGRMSSIFFYANVLASYFVITLTLSLGLLVETMTRRESGVRASNVTGKAESRSFARSQESGWKGTKATGSKGDEGFERSQKKRRRREQAARASVGEQIFLIMAVLGNVIALILTNSRNAWAIALLVCLAFASYQGWRWLLTGVVAVAGGVLGAAFAPPPVREWLRKIVPAFFWARLTDQLYPNRPVAELRVTQWKFAWSLIWQHPWTGWGLRNFSPIYESKMHFFIGHPHNLLLMLSAETGLPATLLFLTLVGWIVVRSTLLLHRSRLPGSTPEDSLLPVSSLSFPLPIASSLSHKRDRIILFTYLTAFLGCTLFSLLDITLFDVRINLFGWLLLAAICGLEYHHQTKPNPDSQSLTETS